MVSIRRGLYHHVRLQLTAQYRFNRHPIEIHEDGAYLLDVVGTPAFPIAGVDHDKDARTRKVQAAELIRMFIQRAMEDMCKVGRGLAVAFIVIECLKSKELGVGIEYPQELMIFIST